MSLAKLLGFERPTRRKLVCYEIPLFNIAEQLPLELLRTGMWWVWKSVSNLELPDRPLTLLTPDSAAAFARDFAEHDEEYRRWMLIVGGTNGSEQAILDPDALKKELQAFSESAETRVTAVIFQIGDSEYEEFIVDSALSATLRQLLQGLSEQVGTTPDHLGTSSGERVLKRVLRGL
jgi:hypothetical protein